MIELDEVAELLVGGFGRLGVRLTLRPHKLTMPGTLGHGAREKRTLKVTVDDGILFPHAAQAIQVTRKIRKRNSRKWRTETVLRRHRPHRHPGTLRPPNTRSHCS